MIANGTAVVEASVLHAAFRCLVSPHADPLVSLQPDENKRNFLLFLHSLLLYDEIRADNSALQDGEGVRWNHQATEELIEALDLNSIVKGVDIHTHDNLFN